MVFDQDGIEDVVTEHFKGIFNGSRVSPRELMERPLEGTEDAHDYTRKTLNEDEFEKEVCEPYTTSELNDLLDNLPCGKACSTDHIPNELLKHTSRVLRIYLQLLLNKIMADGEVPESLNQGKCVLIHKVKKR